MKVPLGASGSSQMTAKLLVPSGAAPKESGGESFFPVQVNPGGIGPPAISAGEVSSMVFIFVVAVDAAGDGLEVFSTFSVHPVTNTVANTLVIIKMVKNFLFIVIPLSPLFVPLPHAACCRKCFNQAPLKRRIIIIPLLGTRQPSAS